MKQGDKIESMNLATWNFGIYNGQRKVLKTTFFPALMSVAILLLVASPCFSASPVTVKPKPDSADKFNTVSKKTSGPDNKAVANGEKLFEKLTCAGCHPNGENSLHPYRPIKGPGFLARYKEDGQIEVLIRTGVPRAGMPAFNKAELSDKNMKDLIAFIRSLTPTIKK